MTAGPGLDAGARTHFGFSQVALGDKQALVDDVFRKVARRYDLMNDLMSMGLHRAWKDVLTAMVKPRGAFNCLDVAGGTGDVAFRIAAAGGARTHVTVADINAAMLAVGAERAAKQGLDAQVEFVEANAEALPFADGAYDAYTIAFGIRNVPRVDVALREAYRVLKRGGRFLCLEFSHVDVPVLDAVYDAYSFNVLPLVGRAVAGDGEPYRYLAESIRQFETPQRFQDMVAEAGFSRARTTVLTGGIVAIHSGWKL